MNYTELKTNIEDICELTFTDDQLAMFTKQAEQKIYNAVQIPALRKNVTGTMTASNVYLSVPTDFLYVYSLAVIDGSGNYTFLLNKDVNFVREAYPAATPTGLPKHYAVFDDTTFILGPTPDSTYTFELHYKYRPDSLTAGSDSGTTWLSTNAPDALLYGTLVEAATFLKVPEEGGQYEQRFIAAVAALKKLGEGYGARDEARYDINRS